ncbi:MAG: hypothetical protein ACPGVN_04045 [Alphaproteobacteria bacterium]
MIRFCGYVQSLVTIVGGLVVAQQPVLNPLAGINIQKASRLCVSLIACLGLTLTLTSCSWIFPNRVVQKHDYVSLRNDPAKAGLELRSTDIEKLKTLCLPKYNYWCLKTPGSTEWKGQTGEDLASHAIFSHPIYSARAFTRVMRTYHFKHKLRTAREILSRYAPTSDCIGSKAYCPQDSRYLYGIKDLPYGKIGSQWVQYSTEKVHGFTEGGECFVKLMYCPRGFNPTNEYAESIAKSVGKGIDDDLELFDAQGNINMEVAVPLFTAFARWEIGSKYVVNKHLIIRGAMLERRDFFAKQRKTNG